MTEIRFYRTREPHGFLSNFYVGTPILYNGHVFKTSEHLYQALKYGATDPEFFKKVRDAKTAREAADLGREGGKMRDDWDQARIFAMRIALLMKFEDVELRILLRDTGDSILIEDAVGDSFWGIGGGSGKNMLGVLLMETRKFYNEIWDVSPHEEAAEISSLQADICGRLRTPQYKSFMP